MLGIVRRRREFRPDFVRAGLIAFVDKLVGYFFAGIFASKQLAIPYSLAGPLGRMSC